MAIPFINLQAQYQQHQEALNASIQRVLDHGRYIMGPEISALEEQLADFLGVKHALACSSGTDALVMPLMCKKLSTKEAIFTSPFTFFASAESITLAGGTPVFVDIDPDTYNIDPEQLKIVIEKTLHDGSLTPRGIMPVDIFGIAANYDEINKIAESYGLFVIEDAAQSFGADYHGAKAGGLAPIGATSFYPAKPLGCYGDGGAVFTNDTELFEKMVSLRVHGQATDGNKYDNVRIGLNARMDTIQAAILIEKLKFYEDELIQRNRVADTYDRELEGIVKTPYVPPQQSSVWAQYSVQVDNRDKVTKALNEKGIPTAIFYPIPIHLSTAYKNLGHQAGDFPVTENVAERIFSLPMHPYLEEKQILTITEAIKQAG